MPPSILPARARLRRCATGLSLTLIALLAIAAQASAITPSGDALALGTAAMRSQASLASASWDDAPVGQPAAIATESLAGFGVDANPYLVLSSGNAALAPNAPQGGLASALNHGDRRGEAYDVTALRLNLTVPSGTNCVSLKFRYFSEEYPEYVNQGYNDGFTAEVDPTSPWTMSNHDITAPDNFAFMPGGDFVSINSATMTAANAAGTIYDGGTQMLTAATPVTPGAHSLVLSVWDDGDEKLDSAAFIDDIAIFNTLPGGCTPGATDAAADSVAPDTTVTAPAATTGPDTSIAFASNESSTSFECKLDAGAFLPCGPPLHLSGLASGSHTFQVRATDAAGNTDATPASTTWTVDATPPDTTITSGPATDHPVSSSSATLAFDGGEAGATYECKLDAGAWTPCSTPQDYVSLGDGSHTFRVRATDAYGNVDATPATRTWTVDTTPPAASFATGPAALVRSSTADLTLASTEDGSTFECRLDADAWAACTSPIHLTGLTDGAHTLHIRATDAAGNTGAEATRIWTVDTRAPVADTTGGPSAVTSSATADIALGADEDGATFECSLDGAAWAACISPGHLTGLADGSHTLRVRATDAAGNTGAEATRTWTVDTASPGAPAVDVTTAPTTPSSDPSPTISFGGESGATFECRLDGGTWAACTSPLRLTDRADGPHTLEVRQTDGAGNASQITEYHWVVDTGRPASPTVLAGPEGEVRPGTARFAFAGEAGATLQCRVDRGEWVSCGTSLDLTGLGAGGHLLEVRQIDAAGNIGDVAQRTWTVKAAAPEPTPASTSTSASTPRTVVGTVGTFGGTTGSGSGSGGADRRAENAPTAVVEGGELPVGCRVEGDSIRTCTVEVRVGGKLVGRGTATYAQPGTTSARVSVHLSAAARAHLQSGDTAMKATFTFRATTFAGERPLVGRTTAVLQPTARWIMPSDGLFATNSARLSPKIRRYLRAIAPMLRGAKVVRVEGHTDSRGSRASNIGLGLRRARAVAAQLRRLGVKAELVAVSRGESRPRATNRTAGGRWRNRRVELRVLR